MPNTEKRELNKEEAEQIINDIKKAKENFTCPITQSLIKEPGMCEDGILYEKSAIEKWLKKYGTSPSPTRAVYDKNVFPSHMLKNLITEMIENTIKTALQYVPIFIENLFILEAKQLICVLEDLKDNLTDVQKTYVEELTRRLEDLRDNLTDVRKIREEGVKNIRTFIEKRELNKEEAAQIIQDIKNAKGNFICPISQELIKEPGMCEDGICYEKSAIENWIEKRLEEKDKIATSPWTRKKLSDKNVFPSQMLKNLIQEMIENTIKTTMKYVPIFIENLFISEAKELICELKEFKDNLTGVQKRKVEGIKNIISFLESSLEKVTNRDIEYFSANGWICCGKIEYDDKRDRIYLKDAKLIDSDGNVLEGKFEYVPSLKDTCLTEGKVTFASGVIHDGRFEYSPQRNGMQLVDGKRIDQNGKAEEIKVVGMHHPKTYKGLINIAKNFASKVMPLDFHNRG